MTTFPTIWKTKKFVSTRNIFLHNGPHKDNGLLTKSGFYFSKITLMQLATKNRVISEKWFNFGKNIWLSHST